MKPNSIKTLFNPLFLPIILICTTCGEGFNIGGTPPTTQINGEKYAEYDENPFIQVAEEPVSTFSVDADGGAYANTRRFLNDGQNPPPAAVRIEEYINYFAFDYEDPINGENVALNSELATCPWNASHHILRIGMKGKTLSENELAFSNYVFLIDVSGSMDLPDKLGILKAGFKTITDHLKDQDRVAIVTYAGESRVVLASTPGSEKETIKSAIDQLGARGSTAGAAGILTAYTIAQQNFIPKGNNRIILGTDGDFNVGTSSTDELVDLIKEKRASGIYLTVLGVGRGNLNDHMMEQIANKGNGNYEYIDNIKQIQKIFTYERSKFYTVAKDSKIQITFNPNKVEAYRLIGYENRSLNNEDFQDDSTDAGEIGSSQTITALYELALSNNASAEPYAQFDFRYKMPEDDQNRSLHHPITAAPTDISASSENMRFAVAVGGFGLIMKQSQYKGNASKQMLIGLAQNAAQFDPHGFRSEFIDLVRNWIE